MDMQIEEDGKPPELVGPLPSSDVRFDWKCDPRRGQRITSLWRSIPERADVLFGLRRAWDEFANVRARDFRKCKNFNNRQPFRLVPSEFIRHARKMRPERPDATV